MIHTIPDTHDRSEQFPQKKSFFGRVSIFLSSKPSSRAVLVLAVVAVVLLLVLVALQLFLPVPKDQQLSEREKHLYSELARCKAITYESQKDFEFVAQKHITDRTEAEKILLKFGDIEYLRQAYSISEEIMDMHFAEEHNKVVYLTGTPAFYENPNHIREVRVLDLETATTSILFTHQTRYVPSPIGKIMAVDLASIRSITLSTDQTRVMIITDQKLLVYDLLSGSLVFSHNGISSEDLYRDTQNDRHFFNSFTFSPGDSKGVLAYGAYEGSTYHLLDFSSGKITSLEKGGYGDGTFVRAWLGDKIVYTDTTRHAGEHSEFLCLQDLGLSEPKCIEVLSVHRYDEPKKMKAIDGALYALTGRLETARTFEGCNNVNVIFDFSPKYDSLVKVSFEEETAVELLHKDVTRVSGFVFNAAILDFTEYTLDGEPGLLVRLRQEDESIAHAFLDPEVPEKLTQLRLSVGE